MSCDWFCNGMDLSPFCYQHCCHKAGNSKGCNEESSHPNHACKSWKIQTVVSQLSDNPLIPSWKVTLLGEERDEETDILEDNADRVLVLLYRMIGAVGDIYRASLW